MPDSSDECGSISYIQTLFVWGADHESGTCFRRTSHLNVAFPPSKSSTNVNDSFCVALMRKCVEMRIKGLTDGKPHYAKTTVGGNQTQEYHNLRRVHYNYAIAATDAVTQNSAHTASTRAISSRESEFYRPEGHFGVLIDIFSTSDASFT